LNNLTIINQNGKLVTDSREVADMVDKRHSDILSDIRGYIEHLTNGNFRSLDFFLPNAYIDGKGETRPCYLLTKKGCDMVANKMTGEKGVLFTATYVTKFDEMEQELKSPKPTCIEDILIQSLQEMKDIKKQLNEFGSTALSAKAESTAVKVELQDIRDVITLSPISWRKDTVTLINKIALTLGGYEHIKIVREESYKLLEERMGASLAIRLTNKRRRMADEGVCKSKRDKLSKVDIIAEDKKLIEGFVAIVKEMAIKNKVA